MEIQIGVLGKIIAGDEAGSFIKILDDSKNSGGFLILTATTHEMNDGFDNLVENKSSLKQYFIESGWDVRWL
jgi:hypothetical protein